MEDLDHGDLHRGSHVANILPHLGEHDVGTLPPHGLKVGFMAEFLHGLFAYLAILGGLWVHIGAQGRVGGRGAGARQKARTRAQSVIYASAHASTECSPGEAMENKPRF